MAVAEVLLAVVEVSVRLISLVLRPVVQVIKYAPFLIPTLVLWLWGLPVALNWVFASAPAAVQVASGTFFVACAALAIGSLFAAVFRLIEKNPFMDLGPPPRESLPRWVPSWFGLDAETAREVRPWFTRGPWVFLQWSIGYVFVTTLGFAVATVMLRKFGALSEQGLHHAHQVTNVMATYLWNLANMVPALDIPASMHWQQPHPPSDAVGGLVLLSYKLVVVIPAVGIGVAFIQERSRLKWDQLATDHVSPEGRAAHQQKTRAPVANTDRGTPVRPRNNG